VVHHSQIGAKQVLVEARHLTRRLIDAALLPLQHSPPHKKGDGHVEIIGPEGPSPGKGPDQRPVLQPVLAIEDVPEGLLTILPVPLL
jgi:hypothetical protein